MQSGEFQQVRPGFGGCGSVRDISLGLQAGKKPCSGAKAEPVEALHFRSPLPPQRRFLLNEVDMIASLRNRDRMPDGPRQKTGPSRIMNSPFWPQKSGEVLKRKNSEFGAFVVRRSVPAANFRVEGRVPKRTLRYSTAGVPVIITSAGAVAD